MKAYSWKGALPPIRRVVSLRHRFFSFFDLMQILSRRVAHVFRDGSETDIRKPNLLATWSPFPPMMFKQLFPSRLGNFAFHKIAVVCCSLWTTPCGDLPRFVVLAPIDHHEDGLMRTQNETEVWVRTETKVWVRTRAWNRLSK